MGRQTAVIAAALVLVAALALGAVWTLRGAEDRGRRIERHLGSLNTHAYHLSAVEWEAIATGRLAPGLAAEGDEAAIDLAAACHDLLGVTPDEPFATVVESTRVYLDAVRSEFALLEDRGVEEAQRLDEERVDPALDRLLEEMEVASRSAAQRIERAEDIQLLGSAVALSLGTLAMLALLVRLARIRRRAAMASLEHQAMAELSRRQEQFATMAAHELRTPLTGLLGSVEMLERKRDSLSEGSAQEFLAICRSQANRLRRVAEDLEVTVRPAVGSLRFHVEPVNVVAAIEAVVIDLGEDARTRVEIDAPGGATANTDPDRLAQVLANLIRNALQWSPADEAVVVCARRDGDAVTIAVSDHGPGIEPGRQPGLFERFGDSESGSGFGIGLWVVRELATAMGGTVTVESALGAGSTFTVTLPSGPTSKPTPDLAILSDPAAN